MTILKELLDLLNEDPNDPNLMVNQKKVEYTKQRDAAYARAKWHKAQAQKYKSSSDPEEQAAAKAHDEAEMDWIYISQEFGHKSPTAAQRQIQRANEKLAKSKLAKQEADEKYGE